MVTTDPNEYGPLDHTRSHTKQYYEDCARVYISGAFNRLEYTSTSIGARHNRHQNIEANLDLYYGKPHAQEYVNIEQPYGNQESLGPKEKVKHFDICSTKIITALGMEAQRKFPWKLSATNPEATTRKEQAERNFVKQEALKIVMAAAQSEEVPAEENPNFERLLRQFKAGYTDPAEMQAVQITNGLTRRERVETLSKEALKMGMITGIECAYFYEKGGHPRVDYVHPMDIDFDLSGDSDLIHKSEWVVHHLDLSPSEILSRFPKTKKSTLQKMYQQARAGGNRRSRQYTAWGDSFNDEGQSFHGSTIQLTHVCWQGLAKVNTLTYLDPTSNTEEKKVVDSSYKINKDQGDVSIETHYIPQAQEVWAVFCGADDMEMLYYGPVKYQYSDIDNMYDRRLPYVGIVHSDSKGQLVSLMDRIRPYQFLYNVLKYKTTKLIATDKGKRAFIDVSAIPKSLGVTLEEFERSLEENVWNYLDPSTEGQRYAEMGNIIKMVDLSLGSDIGLYQRLMDYIDVRAGQAIGIPPSAQGQIQQRDAVANVATALQMSTNALDVTFAIHDTFKQEMLTYLLDFSRAVYAETQPKYLDYILDEQTLGMLQLDNEMLQANTYGFNFTATSEAAIDQQYISTMAQAYIQNGGSMAQAMRIQNSQSLQEAIQIQEQLESEQIDREQNAAKAEEQREDKRHAQAIEMETLRSKHTIDAIVTKETMQLERELKTRAVTGAGFGEDLNNNQVNDAVEAADMLLKEKKNIRDNATKERIVEKQLAAQKEMQKNNTGSKVK